MKRFQRYAFAGNGSEPAEFPGAMLDLTQRVSEVFIDSLVPIQFGLFYVGLTPNDDSPSSALDVTWVNNGVAVSTYVLHKQSDIAEEPDRLEILADGIEVPGTSFETTITGLKPDTMYSAWVVSIMVGGDYSDVVQADPLRTATEPLGLALEVTAGTDPESDVNIYVEW